MQVSGSPILYYAWKTAQILLLILALAWLAALALLWTFQRNLLFLAPRESPGPPPAGYRQVQIETSDGLALNAWYRPTSAGRSTILFFSGNAASLPASAEWCQALADAGFGIF